MNKRYSRILSATLLLAALHGAYAQDAPGSGVNVAPLAAEKHFKNLRQLTFGGQNAVCVGRAVHDHDRCSTFLGQDYRRGLLDFALVAQHLEHDTLMMPGREVRIRTYNCIAQQDSV